MRHLYFYSAILVPILLISCQSKEVESNPETGKYQKLAIDILTTLDQRSVAVHSAEHAETEPIKEVYEVSKVIEDEQVETLILPADDVHKRGKVVEAKVSPCANNPSLGEDKMQEIKVDLDQYESLKEDKLLIHIRTFATYSDDCVSDKKKLRKLFIYHLGPDDRKYDFEMVVNLGEDK